MSMFWLIAGLMLLAAVAAVLIPVWRYRPQAATLTQDAINTRLFRERLTELDGERADGRIDEAQYQQLKLELERTLLTDITETAESSTSSARHRLGIALLAGLLIPLLATGYYYVSAFQGEPAAWLQAREQMSMLVQQAIAKPEQLPPEALENLPDFTRVLQAKVLREGLHDPDQLMLLGICYLELGAVQEARGLMLQALELAPERIDIMMGAAQTMLMSNEGRLDQASANLLHAILRQEPGHQGALMMLGFGAFNGGDYAIAKQAWQLLLSQLPPDSEPARLLKNSIAQAEQLAQQTPEPETGAAPGAPAEQPPGQQPPPVSAETQTAQVSVTVDIAPELQNRFQTNDTLFIYAKAASGPPMPLAAVRQPASGFPVKVVLDDSHAMMPSLKLSNFQQVVVGARISKGGDVRAQSGDLETLSAPLAIDNGPVSIQLTVDQVVP